MTFASTVVRHTWPGSPCASEFYGADVRCAVVGDFRSPLQRTPCDRGTNGVRGRRSPRITRDGSITSITLLLDADESMVWGLEPGADGCDSG